MLFLACMHKDVGACKEIKKWLYNNLQHVSYLLYYKSKLDFKFGFVASETQPIPVSLQLLIGHFKSSLSPNVLQFILRHFCAKMYSFWHLIWIKVIAILKTTKSRGMCGGQCNDTLLVYFYIDISNQSHKMKPYNISTIYSLLYLKQVCHFHSWMELCNDNWSVVATMLNVFRGSLKYVSLQTVCDVALIFVFSGYLTELNMVKQLLSTLFL